MRFIRDIGEARHLGWPVAMIRLDFDFQQFAPKNREENREKEAKAEGPATDARSFAPPPPRVH